MTPTDRTIGIFVAGQPGVSANPATQLVDPPLTQPVDLDVAQPTQRAGL